MADTPYHIESPTFLNSIYELPSLNVLTDFKKEEVGNSGMASVYVTRYLRQL